ncbi:MAG: ABC transporter permease [Gemmatimonadota bacterium]
MPEIEHGGPLHRWAPVGVALAALGITLGLGAISLWAGGYDPIMAASALYRGALSSREAILSVSLVRAVPLVLTGLAVGLAFRAGVWNIGAEGQLYAGAVAGVWVALMGEGMARPLHLAFIGVAACTAGAAWAAIPAYLKWKAEVGEVISTILMNFVGIYLAAYVVHGPLQEARGVFPQTDPIPLSARIPLLLPGSRLHWGGALALLIGVGLWAWFRFARAGFAVRVTGVAPDAARIAGRIPSRRVALGAFLVSGALAGLAGGVEVAGVTHALYEGLSPGWGYTAIAVALLARLHPLGILCTGVLFGILEGGAGAMQRGAGIPAAWVLALEALAILSVLAVEQAWRRVAAASRVAGAGDGGAG